MPKHSVIAEIYPLLPVCVGDGNEPGKVEVDPDPERHHIEMRVNSAAVQHEQLMKTQQALESEKN